MMAREPWDDDPDEEPVPPSQHAPPQPAAPRQHVMPPDDADQGRQVRRRSMRTVAPAADIAEIRIGAVEAWEQNLLRAGNGDPLAVQVNIAYALAASPELAGKLWYNEFAHTITVYGALPWNPDAGPREWNDTDHFCLISWSQGNPMINANTAIVKGAVHQVAHMQRFDPLLQMIDAIAWDQAPRLDTWTVRLLGCEETPLACAIGRKFIIALVARARHPGCKADNVLILYGDEGLGKSTILKALVSDPFFTDEVADLGSKDAAMAMRGVWLIEMSDLETLGRVEGIRANAFFSRSADRFRPPYGQVMIEQPRRSLLCGTTNEGEVLKHATGLRRYWIIEVTKADVAGMLAERQQLIAEAAHYEKLGEAHWLTDPALIEAQRADAKSHRVTDTWFEEIQDWLSKPWNSRVAELTVRQVLYHALGIQDRTKWNKQMEMRVAQVLKDLGFERQHTSKGKVWCKPSPKPPAPSN